jgi:hypothetical protein
MTYEQFMVDLRAKNAQAKAQGVAFTVPAAMRCAWEAGIVEGRRIAELEHQAPAAPAAPEPEPVRGDADAVDRLTRVAGI